MMLLFLVWITGGSKASSRPLSANRRSHQEIQDPEEEASSVAQAIQVENKVVTKIKKRNTKSAPGRHEVNFCCMISQH